jgi:hypothetical protein
MSSVSTGSKSFSMAPSMTPASSTSTFNTVPSTPGGYHQGVQGDTVETHFYNLAYPTEMSQVRMDIDPALGSSNACFEPSAGVSVQQDISNAVWEFQLSSVSD